MKNLWGKIANLSFYVILIGAMLYVISNGKNPKGSGDQGILYTFYNNFFKNADTWNLIFLLIMVCLCIILFIPFDVFLTFINKKISARLKWASFLSSNWFRNSFQRLMTLGLLVLFFVMIANGYVVWLGVKKTITISDIDKVHDSIPALVLGTSKHLKTGKNKGKENKYFTYRIEAARELWEAGKVNQFIVSGDKTGEYDETRDMKNDLMAFGVPESKVKIDTSGLRTMDSMLRLRNLFHIRECFIVSQDFHVWRAIFQASLYNMKPHGFYAKGSSTWGMILREFQARPKAVLDLVFFNMMPRDEMNEDQARTHKKFEVNSDRQLILLGLVIVAVIASLYLFFKYID